MSGRCIFMGGFMLIFSIFMVFTLPVFAQTYTITATAGEHGTIIPSGSVVVSEGEDVTFTMQPEPGYMVENVLINDMTLGAMTAFTFQAVKASHQIHATFKPSSSIPLYTITATSGEHGRIDPPGDIKVIPGEDVTFTLLPDAGYEVADILIDNTSAGAKNSYTFAAVNAPHTLHALFKATASPDKQTEEVSETVQKNEISSDKTDKAALQPSDSSQPESPSEKREEKHNFGIILILILVAVLCAAGYYMLRKR